MSLLAMSMMIATQGLVIISTIYFLRKVLNSPKK